MMVYSLTMYEDQYDTLLAALPDLAKQAKPVRDPALASDKQCRYMASLMTADRPKTQKSTAWKLVYAKLLNDPTMTREAASTTLDQLTGKDKALVTDNSDIPF